MRTVPLLLASGAVALFAAGCGGSDNKSSDSGARGYDETIAAANAICKKATVEVKQASKGINGSAKNDAPIVKQITATSQKYVDEMKAIKPDPKLQSAFDDYVAALDEQQAATEAAQKAAESGNDAAYRQALQAIGPVNKKGNQAALKLGAKECAKD